MKDEEDDNIIPANEENNSEDHSIDDNQDDNDSDEIIEVEAKHFEGATFLRK